MQQEPKRSTALDAWDYRVPFGRFHMRWEEEEITPAFEQDQAYGILLQETALHERLEIWAHREVLVTFSSEYVSVGSGPAEGEPAWVVMVAGQVKEGAQPGGILGAAPPGTGVIVQALIHARRGDVLIGTSVPVQLRRR